MEAVYPPPGDAGPGYAVRYSVDYPDRDLNRLTSAFRIFTVIPIAIVLGTVAGGSFTVTTPRGAYGAAGAGGLLFFGPLLMILFCRKYPRWWFDWNQELARFTARVGAYFALMSDVYPSTDEEQYVHLDLDYPDVERDLSRGMPLVKWLLAIPHYLVLFALYIGALFAVVAAWFAVLFTGRFPRSLFDYLVGVGRWHWRVAGYAFLLVTDDYPPFSLSA